MIPITALPEVIKSGTDLIREGLSLIKQHREINLAKDLHSREMEFRNRTFEEIKLFQKEQMQQHYREQLKLAAFNRETAIGIEEYKRIIDTLPLRAAPTTILQSYREKANRNQPLPLLVIIAPPRIDYDRSSAPEASNFPAIEMSLSQEIRYFLRFFEQNNRPVKFLPGLWETKMFHSEAAVENIVSIFKAIPVLLLESEANQHFLNLRAFSWGLFGAEPGVSSQMILSKFPYRSVLNEFAREDARRWKPDRDKYLEMGKSRSHIRAVGKEDDKNLMILEEESMDHDHGINRPREYVHTARHVERLTQFLGVCHNLTIGLAIDSYSLFNFQKPPILPHVLPHLGGASAGSAVPPELVQQLVASYCYTYEQVVPELSHWLPTLYLDLASAFTQSIGVECIRDLIERSIDAWLNASGIFRKLPLEEAVALALEHRDYLFVKRVRDALLSVSDVKTAGRISLLLQKERPSLEHFA